MNVMSPRGSVWALVPAKGFQDGKTRLSPICTPEQRAGLQRAMLCDVLSALRRTPLIDSVAVVSPDPEAASVAKLNGAYVIAEPAGHADMNSAVEAGVRRLIALGANTVAILSADVPFADQADIGRAVGLAIETDRPVVVPDRHRDGTNLLVVHRKDQFRFRYGPGSLARHSRRNGTCDPFVVELASLELDVDTPADLAALRAESAGRGLATSAFLASGRPTKAGLEHI